MANIFDYIQWRDLSIEKVEFNEIDNLILARLSYFPLDGVVNGEEEISITEAYEKYEKLENKELEKIGLNHIEVESEIYETFKMYFHKYLDLYVSYNKLFIKKKH